MNEHVVEEIKEVKVEYLDAEPSPKDEEKANTLVRIVDWVIETSSKDIDVYVSKLESQNPGITKDALAKKIVNRKAMKNGLVGAVTGLGGLITLPVTVPADIALSWKIQISMTLAIATVYGHTKDTTDLKTDIFLVLAGDSAKESLKRVGIEVGKGFAKKAIQRHMNVEIMKKIWKYIPQKIITIGGQKSLLSFTKMIPLVGAPIGFGFDWVAAKAAGKMAIKYYGGGD